MNLNEKNSIYGVDGVVHLYPENICAKGIAKITTYEFDENQNPLVNLRYMRDGRSFMRMFTGTYVRLHVDGMLMMSDTPMERLTNVDFIENAKGKVLIAGLGVGLILQAILDKEDVEEVYVVEKYQDVIDLVASRFSHPKLKVVCCDIFHFDISKDEKFDTIYFDIWADINEDNLDEMRTLHAKFRKNKRDKSSWMNSWLRDYLKKERAKSQRNAYW